MAFTNNWDNDVGIDPSYSFIVGASFKTLVSTGESGKQRRRAKSVGPFVWQLDFSTLSVAEADKIWQFYLDCKGAFDTFTWTDPVSSVSYTVHFKNDTLTKDYFTYGLYNLSLEFEEII